MGDPVVRSNKIFLKFCAVKRFAARLKLLSL